jgi:hypothetical protein
MILSQRTSSCAPLSFSGILARSVGRSGVSNMSTVLSPLVSEFETEEQETSYNAWLKAKVEASLADPRPNLPHATTIAKARALLDSKKKNRATN